MSLRGINKIILSYVVEIFCIIGFMVFSYVLFTSNKLESYAMIAEESSTYNYGRQTAFTPYTVDELNDINEDELLLAGTLTLENIYDKDRTYDVVLYLDSSIDIENTKVYINNVLQENVVYKEKCIVINQVKLIQFEKISFDVLVYGVYADEYSFELV